VTDYPWLRRPTNDEITEGRHLFNEGWRGISSRNKLLALWDRAAYIKWLSTGRPHSYADYLRLKAPTQTVSFHVYREVKRREKEQHCYV